MLRRGGLYSCRVPNNITPGKQPTNEYLGGLQPTDVATARLRFGARGPQCTVTVPAVPSTVTVAPLGIV